MASAEEQLARIRKQQREGQRRYREKHKIKKVGCNIYQEKYELFIKKLAKEKKTQKEIIENAIDKFLEE